MLSPLKARPSFFSAPSTRCSDLSCRGIRSSSNAAQVVEARFQVPCRHLAGRFVQQSLSSTMGTPPAHADMRLGIAFLYLYDLCVPVLDG